jgi:putative ABC transport system permease protein
MLRRIIQSFLIAFQNIRGNFFHTFLSVLGIVIGVGALVSILSLIDGMQDFAKKQISSTTTLNMILVYSDPVRHVNDMTLRKDSVTIFQYQDYLDIQSTLSRPSKSYLYQRVGKEILIKNDTTKAATYTTGVAGLEADSILYGRSLSREDLTKSATVCVITEALAKILSGKNKINNLIGKEIVFAERTLSIVGVIIKKHAQGPELFYPFTLSTFNELNASLPQFRVEAENVQDVGQLKSDISKFLESRFSSKHDFKITTNELRVEQAAKGFLLFKVIMGLIVGISVVVGGVGVMNVLLISVTQRTVEIGIRKAVGANRRDIILLFLSESVTVSAFGSLIGLIFGTLFTMAAVPIVTKLTEIPFYASYTWDTFLIISMIAIFVGIAFGTYPAIRASRLDPVEAIRHE